MMDTQPNTEFTLNLLILITRMVAQSDYHAINQLGIRKDQIEKLQSLTTQQLQQMALITQSRFVSIAFDSAALDAAIVLGNQRVAVQNTILALLDGGASNAIMRKLFGVTLNEISEMRRFIELPKLDGRPLTPTENQVQALWQVWQEPDFPKTSAIAKQLLYLYDKTGVRINIIWPLLQEWLKDRREDPVFA
ncbi:MAG: STY4526/YPO1902 family pathogenicity island replication protein [Methylococcales bacterium]